MPDVALIHGYAMGIDGWFRKPIANERLFPIFSTEVRAGRAAAFEWSIYRKLGWQTINPWAQYQLYQDERNQVTDGNLHLKLQRWLEQARPKVIVTHSLGSELLRQHALKYKLPSSVKVVVMNQADIGVNEKWSSPVPLINTYCPWDVLLWLGSLLHREWRVGQRPWSAAQKNILFPAWPSPNLHTSAVKDPRFLQLVLTLIN